MPYNLIKYVDFHAELFDLNSKPTDTFTVALQTFDTLSSKWETLAESVPVNKGIINFTLVKVSRFVFNANFYKNIAAGNIPPTRLVNSKTLKATPIELIAEDTRFTYIDRVSMLTISFGKNYEIPQSIPAASRLDNEKETLQIFAKFPIASGAAPKGIVIKEIGTSGSDLAKLNLNYDLLKITLAEKEALNTNIQKQLSLKIDENNSALATNRTLQETLKTLQNNSTSLEKELKLNAAELDNKKSEIAKLNEQMTTLSKGGNKANLDQLEMIKKLDTLNATLKTKQLDFDKLVKVAQDTDLQLSKVKDQHTNLSLEYKNIEKVLATNLDELKKQKATNERLIANMQLSEKSIAEWQSKYKGLEDKLAKQNTTKKEYKPIAQPVSTVYSSIFEEFQKTNELAKASNIKLSNITLNIKTFIEHDADGIRLQLVDANKLTDINANALSDIKIEIGNTDTSTSSTFLAPDLIGLTETAARRVIDALGLRIKAVYQYVNTEAPVGQAFRQSPAASTLIMPNETITLIFAKENS